jgi:hypothetical protein
MFSLSLNIPGIFSFNADVILSHAYQLKIERLTWFSLDVNSLYYGRSFSLRLLLPVRSRYGCTWLYELVSSFFAFSAAQPVCVVKLFNLELTGRFT